MKKKRILLGVTITILLIISSILVYLLVIRKDNNNIEERLNINEIITIPKIDISLGDTFYLKKEDNNKLVVYDFDNKKLSEQELDEDDFYEIYNNKYIIIKNDKKALVVDQNGKEIKSGTYAITVYSNDKNYIIIDNKLYNGNMEEVYELSDNLIVDNYINNKLYSSNIINNILILTFEDKENNMLIDLTTKEVLYKGYDDYFLFNENNDTIEYIAIKQDDTYDIYNMKNKKVVMSDVSIDENYIITKDNKKMYIYNNKIYEDNTKINKKYHLSTKDCEVGGKLLDNKNNTIIDKCMLYYEEVFNDVIIGSNIKEHVLYQNNKVITNDYISKVGDYILTYNYDEEGAVTKYKLYNKKGEKKDKSNEVSYLGNNIYLEYNTIEGTNIILDSNLNKIVDNINSIDCPYKNYCTVSDDNLNKKIYRDGKEVSSNIYYDITMDEDKIIAVGLFNTYIYKLGTKKEINIDTKEEVDINIDEIIDKYKLDNIKDKIKDNEELFKKYAYIVENNNNLLDYKKQVMDMFDLIVSNKEYLNELRLLNKLKELNIVYSDDLGRGVGGTYSDYDTKVSLLDKDNYTLYHELTHFADFSFNNYNNIYNLYNCNNKYVVKKGYDISCSPIYIDTNFITEAGAELYSGKYYTHELEAYTPAPTILEALEYICGTKELNEWFFNSDAYFKKLWLEAGYTTEETEKIISSLSNRTKILSSGNDDTIFIVDTLIDLYKIKKNDNFMNDSKFKYILRTLIDYRRDFTTSNYSSELNTIVSENNNIAEVLNSSLDGYTLYKTFGDLIIIDGKEYISSLGYKGNEIGALLIDYDFDNNKVLDYKYTLRDN